MTKAARGPKYSFLISFLFAATTVLLAQSNYKVITVSNGGTVSGTVKWSGPEPRELKFPVTKDPQICDPESKKTVDLERLIIGPQGGVANTIVFLKDITAAFGPGGPTSLSWAASSTGSFVTPGSKLAGGLAVEAV